MGGFLLPVHRLTQKNSILRTKSLEFFVLLCEHVHKYEQFSRVKYEHSSQ